MNGVSVEDRLNIAINEMREKVLEDDIRAEAKKNARKTKIVFEQLDAMHKISYRVISLTNRTQPKIGDILKEEDLQKLLVDENLTVDIKPKNRR